MRNIIYILIFLLIQCRSEDSPKLDVTNEISITIDGKQYKIYNNEVGGNFNCNHIFVSTYYQKDGIHFTFNILLNKKGAILNSELRDKSNNVNQLYLTPNFNPASTFVIKNFVYNEEKNEVDFSFQATLFLEGQTNKTKTITGNISVKTLQTKPCQIANSSVSYDSNIFKFNQIYYLMSSNNQNTIQKHRFFSNNGYKIDFLFENDLWYLPLGTYQFSKNSSTNIVSLFKYIGPLKADQLKEFIEYDWGKYETVGNFVIQNKFTENGIKQISGVVNMEVRKNNMVVYVIKNMNFQTGTIVP